MDSDTRDDRPHQRPRANPEGTRWEVPPSGHVPPTAAAGTPQAGQGAPSPAAQATVTPYILAQMLQFALQTTQQQSQQMSQLLAQTAQIQQQILQAQSRPRSARKKSDPPCFEGSDDDDLELWIFSTEQYYTDFQAEMHDLSSSFSDMEFANLVQAWYRDIKISLGSSPFTWEVFKERIRTRFRDEVFKFKTLTKNVRAEAQQVAAGVHVKVPTPVVASRHRASGRSRGGSFNKTCALTLAVMSLEMFPRRWRQQ
ncbi:hypothetical protein PR001_g5910 [Phytophthora rubi]|uniref:Retrotransposon gag domain-containing protein n=1 Tax=Phytophthora rubi TaxID=129364 RepID=A0A6A3NFS8_9STRA|nr:hypothetical protein PR002_g4711 [Phytophthora rubi]KAE9043167.1 hypothetical protein PR001_g5910 [Phytophthora rubi]